MPCSVVVLGKQRSPSNGAMTTMMLVLDPSEQRRLKRERKRSGADRYDEVWNGVYVMAPLANNQHQWLAQEIATAIRQGVRYPEDGMVFCGCNVSDREVKWEKNYRCPDV